MRPEDLVAKTDWTAVDHAYGPGPEVPQTPDILAALLSRDAAVQARALSDLYVLVHHQDTVYPATPPAMEFVVAILDDPRTLTPVPPHSRRRTGACGSWRC
ncbi:hypothetical protein [Dactylosporangium sp. NPDC051541]|uniref:hypothetical protein n=1 Tax=Dactylosporangium sp. NPDC051541 TaxID=3363977 RepID=UPI00379AF221